MHIGVEKKLDIINEDKFLNNLKSFIYSAKKILNL